MLILDLWGISFHTVVVFGLGKNLLFKSILGRCAVQEAFAKFFAVHISKVPYHKVLTKYHTRYLIVYRECLFFQICKERRACYDMKGRRDPVKIGTDEFGLPKTGEEF